MTPLEHAGSPGSPDEEARAVAARAARDGYGRLLARLAAPAGDIAAAEDALADALERALRTWPTDGVPRSPEAWLLTVARNRLKDHWKSAATRTGVPLDPNRHAGAHLEEIDPDAVGDRRLELMLVCAHPAVDPAVRTPLMLNAVLGFTAAEVAGALALPPSTVSARLVRAKRRIKGAGIPFAIPDRSVLPERMADVLEAVYGAYAIEWPIGGVERREGMTAEALHLAETLAALAPRDGETHALAALICLSASRSGARRDSDGGFVPLAEQDPARWSSPLIDRGRAHLARAHATGTVGRFGLEAAVQAVHANRRETGTTDWPALLELHRAIHRLAPTLGSGAALAATVAEVDGPAAGLEVLDSLGDAAQRFQPAWVTRAHLLDRVGRVDEAVEALDKAVSLTTDPAERRHLEGHRAGLPDRPGRGIVG